METPRIRVICADDHPVVREGVKAVLSSYPDIEVVATASNGEEAVALFREHKPDVTIMDLKMPKMPGVKAVEAIRRISPQARIIILTTYEGDEHIFQAIQAGAATYVLKDTLSEKLIHLVRAVHKGERPIPEEIAARLAGRIGQPVLTGREIEVLQHIAKGSRNKEIGYALRISEETVQVHVKNILSKLNVQDRTEAVTIGLRRGILQLP